MMAYAKPLPVIDDLNRPYWDALKRGELRLPQCAACGHLAFDPTRVCRRCGSEQRQWPLLSGHGEIWSLGVFHQIYFESFRADTPFTVVLVQLDEGVRLFSNIVGASRDQIQIGRRVEAAFDPVTPDVTLLKFRLA